MTRHLRALLRQAKRRDRFALRNAAKSSNARSLEGFVDNYDAKAPPKLTIAYTAAISPDSYIARLATEKAEREREQLQRRLIIEAGGDPNDDDFKRAARQLATRASAVLIHDHGDWLGRVYESMKP